MMLVVAVPGLKTGEARQGVALIAQRGAWQHFMRFYFY